METDPVNARILTELQRDATIPLDELGTRVGLSRNACWRRVKQMEDAGIIRGRVALLDPNKIGLGLTVFIQIRTNSHTPDWLERFVKATRELPEILGAYRMTGDLDYLVHARVRDVAAYDALYQRLIRRVDMSDCSASFVMEEIKETTALPV
ncbi:Lrp/AsnC family transcriptional regulator [Pontivivens insulae]|uniref:DNA-binding transcriptional activator DecR n=1 Tax=Pontivivens insulae TaxID=1639689 RepID=A0A2R8AC23_9RHOB|nr:Lrp/AsnC family transcriptional regulator [Pontivivens insulae]RED11219.1 AsnC family transcriptional regulator [Pontivivens insulae]SPF29608.1 DNA-binding transcriptional activator DecR [Pontivivens insulae]